MKTTPGSLRLHIGIFGKRNVGKSSLMNRITRHNVSIVSELAGTTTDPVRKAMELKPLGPVVFVDTAGIDDQGTIGGLRADKTRKMLESTDLAILVTEAGKWDEWEDYFAGSLKEQGIPAIVAFNKIDCSPVSEAELQKRREQFPGAVRVSAGTGEGMDDLVEELLKNAPASWFENRPIVSDLVGPGETVLLLTPIDTEAPRGRIDVPHSQTLRDLLDNDSVSIVIKENRIKETIGSLKTPPRLVITDSQVFRKADEDVPAEIPLTSFSILFARHKGDLVTFARGAGAVDSLQDGDRILVAEACTHHPIGDDIGKQQIPRKLRSFTGKNLIFDFAHGRDFPEDLSNYRLVIHCGACAFNRKQVLSRIRICEGMHVPITNYGMILAYINGIFERSLRPFADQYPELEAMIGRRESA